MNSIVIIGCGNVGLAYLKNLCQSDMMLDISLIDIDEEELEGEILDLEHSLVYRNSNISIRLGSYSDCDNADIVVITAGIPQSTKDRMSDLEKANGIVVNITNKLRETSFNGIVLVACNPLDVITELIAHYTDYSYNKVIGTGTMLDTARLKYVLGKHLQVDPRDIHAYIIGEHGDSELVVWSGAQVAGIHINHFCELRGHFNHEESMERLAQEVRDSAYEIIKRKGATYYGVAVAVKRIATAIVKDEHAVLPISSLMQGEFGLNDICLSIPTVIGQNGVEKVVDIYLNNDENEKLQTSAKALKDVLDGLDL